MELKRRRDEGAGEGGSFKLYLMELKHAGNTQEDQELAL